MNKIRVIDLLNKIANGEEVPKKIKYNNKIYSVKGNAIENFVDYCSEEDEWCFNHYTRYENLNDEVEIINKTEEKKIPEKLPIYDCIDAYSKFDTIDNRKAINEIIDYLKSKGE